MSYYGAPIETTVQTSDQLALYSTVQGQPRRASVSALADAVEGLYPTPDSVLDLSSYYIMRSSTSAVVALTSTPVTFGSSVWKTNTTLPILQTSLSADMTNGRFVATRDISAIEFRVGIQGDWPNGNPLTLAVQVGDPTNLYTTEYGWSMVGVTAQPFNGSFSGIATNLNDTQGIIRAGQVVQLVASLATSGNLNLARATIAVRCLDGK